MYVEIVKKDLFQRKPFIKFNKKNLNILINKQLNR